MSTTVQAPAELASLWEDLKPLKPYDKGAVINAIFIRRWSAANGFPLDNVIPLYTDAGIKLRDESKSGVEFGDLNHASAQLSINNEVLAQPGNPMALRREIAEVTDFFIVPVAVFEYFQRKFGKTAQFVRVMTRTGLLRTARATPQLYPSFVRIVPCNPSEGEAVRGDGSSTKLIVNDLEIIAKPIIFACPESTTIQNAVSFALSAWKDGISQAELIDKSLEEFQPVSKTSTDGFPEGIDASRIRCYVRTKVEGKEKEARIKAQESLDKITSGEVKPYFPANWPFAPPGARLAPEVVVDESLGDEALMKLEEETLGNFSRVPVPVDTSAGDDMTWTQINSLSERVSFWPIPDDSVTPEFMIEVRGNVDSESATEFDITAAWPRGRFIAPLPPRFIYPGKLVDALDKQMNWYKAKVLSKNKTNPVTWRVTYLEWSAANDEDVREDLIEPYDTCTKGLPNRKGVHMARVGKPVRLVGKSGSVTTTSSYNYTSMYRSENDQPPQPGRAGLDNLGNTCFMNSILQCVSAMPLLTDLFLDKSRVQTLVNRQSKLGKGGRLAEELTKWLEDMWCGKFPVVNPAGLRAVIVKNTPFDGYEQHDSSEFLTYMLDNIHEELNQCTEKPQTEEVEAKGRDDFLVAKEAWDVHLLRNRSWVCDRYGGQIKSTLVCQQCKNISVKFDYMQFLTLGLPVDKNLTRTVNVIRTSPTVSLTTITVKLGQDDTVQTILDTLANDEVHFSPKLQRRRLILREPTHSNPQPWKGIVASEKKMADELSSKEALYVYELQPNIFCDPVEDLSACSLYPIRIKFPESIHTAGTTTDEIPLLLAVPKSLNDSFVVKDQKSTAFEDSTDFSELCAPAPPPRPPTPEHTQPEFTSGIEGTTPNLNTSDDPESLPGTQKSNRKVEDVEDDDDWEMEAWPKSKMDGALVVVSDPEDDAQNQAPPLPPKRKLLDSVGESDIGKNIASVHESILARGHNYVGRIPPYDPYMPYGYSSLNRKPMTTVKVPGNLAFKAVVELLLSTVLNPEVYPSLTHVMKAKNSKPVMDTNVDEAVPEAASKDDNGADVEEKGSESVSKLTSLKAPSMLAAWGIDAENVPVSVSYAEDWSQSNSIRITAKTTDIVEFVNYGSVSSSIVVDIGSMFNEYNAPVVNDRVPAVTDEPTVELAGGQAILLSAAKGVSGRLGFSYNDANQLSKALVFKNIEELLRTATAPEDDSGSNDSATSRGERMPPKPTTYFSKSGSTSRRSMYYNPHSVTGSSRLNLLDSLKEYSQTELLQDDNAVYCRICKSHTPTTKRLEIFRLPDVLIIVLKRFSTRDFVNYHKNDTPIDYPLLGLDMSDFMAESVRRQYQKICREANESAAVKTGDQDSYYNHPKLFESEFRNAMQKSESLCGFPLQNDYTYDLTGVSLHSGSRTGGHYTANARNFLSGNWMHCDDRRVSDIPLDQAQDDQAYVLCYQRRRSTRDVEPAVPGLAPFKFPQGISRFQNGKNTSDVL